MSIRKGIIMSALQYQAAGCYVAVDQYALSRSAAERSERVQAARAQRAQRKAERQRRRAVRNQESYTTAV